MEKKQLTKIIILSLTVVGLALGLILLPSKATFKRKAAFGNVNVRLQPATGSYAVNQEFNVDIKIEAVSYKVSGMDLKLSFDHNKLEIVRFTPNAQAFPWDLTNNDPGLLGRTTGNARLIAVNLAPGLPTGTFTAGTLRLKGKVIASPVTLTINKSTSQIVGESQTEDVVLAISQTTDGSYSIVQAGPTVTPIPTVTPGGATSTPVPTGTGVPPSRTPILNFKVKFQGITEKRGDMKVRILVKSNLVASSGVFDDVTVTANDAGVYSGRVTLANIQPGDGYRMSIKGPRHLARGFCGNQPAVNARCMMYDANISLTAGENTFDFSNVILEGGDLPNPNEDYKQDGVVNSVDWSLMNSRLGSTSADDLRVADINMDGEVNATDRVLLRNTLETKYGEWE